MDFPSFPFTPRMYEGDNFEDLLGTNITSSAQTNSSTQHTITEAPMNNRISYPEIDPYCESGLQQSGRNILPNSQYHNGLPTNNENSFSYRTNSNSQVASRGTSEHNIQNALVDLLHENDEARFQAYSGYDLSTAQPPYTEGNGPTGPQINDITTLTTSHSTSANGNGPTGAQKNNENRLYTTNFPSADGNGPRGDQVNNGTAEASPNRLHRSSNYGLKYSRSNNIFILVPNSELQNFERESQIENLLFRMMEVSAELKLSEMNNSNKFDIENKRKELLKDTYAEISELFTIIKGGVEQWKPEAKRSIIRLLKSISPLCLTPQPTQHGRCLTPQPTQHGRCLTPQPTQHGRRIIIAPHNFEEMILTFPIDFTMIYQEGMAINLTLFDEHGNTGKVEYKFRKNQSQNPCDTPKKCRKMERDYDYDYHPLEIILDKLHVVSVPERSRTQNVPVTDTSYWLHISTRFHVDGIANEIELSFESYPFKIVTNQSEIHKCFPSLIMDNVHHLFHRSDFLERGQDRYEKTVTLEKLILAMKIHFPALRVNMENDTSFIELIKLVAPTFFRGHQNNPLDRPVKMQDFRETKIGDFYHIRILENKEKGKKRSHSGDLIANVNISIWELIFNLDEKINKILLNKIQSTPAFDNLRKLIGLLAPLKGQYFHSVNQEENEDEQVYNEIKSVYGYLDGIRIMNNESYGEDMKLCVAYCEETLRNLTITVREKKLKKSKCNIL